MLLTPLSVSADLPLPESQRQNLAPVLDAYEKAFKWCGADVERVSDAELAFRVTLRGSRPSWRLSEPDLGLVSRGTFEVIPTETGCRLYLEAWPRSWFLILSILPWLLLIWALGFTAAPWRYLLAFGGLPLFVLLWVVVWANLHAFLEHTNRAFAGRLAPDASPADPCAKLLCNTK